MKDAGNASAGKTEGPDPELKKTPPEATTGSGTESNPSKPGPRKRTYVPIEGARVVKCMACDRFIAEVKGNVEKGRFLCRACGLMNFMSFTA